MKLRMEKAVYGGDGLARIQAGPDPGAASPAPGGKAVFVPYTLPGELVSARMTSEKRGYATAEPLAILEPSRDRIAPVCEYFGVCGGCQYQHAGVETQLQIKLGILKETLQRAHLFPSGDNDSVLGNIAVVSRTPWAYRNRARLQVQKAPVAGGGVELCYRQRASHRNLSVTHCPIAAPLIEQAIAAVPRSGAGSELVQLAAEIEFFTNDSQNVLLASLTTRRPSHGQRGMLERFCSKLHAELPELWGVGLFSLEGRRLIECWGEKSLSYRVAQQDYRVSLGAFFQINRYLLPNLVQIVTSGRSGSRAWDLYAGVGLFSRELGFDEIVAVESDPRAAADLRHNLPQGHRAVHSTALEFLRSQARTNSAPPELILVDPPRAGLGREVCGLLARTATRSIVYVSCEPPTLARDLQPLLQSGFRITRATLVDLFPQTFHIETVMELTRN